MDREYLEDYEQKEKAEYNKFFGEIQEGKFSVGVGRYPSDKRFVKLQNPIAMATVLEKSQVLGLMNEIPRDRSASSNLYAQIPFCGSLILPIPAFPKNWFERFFFEMSDIPEIINFVKGSGRLQIVLSDFPSRYEGLDYLDPFFQELHPPVLSGYPVSTFGNEKEIKVAMESFTVIGEIRFLDFVKRMCESIDPSSFREMLENCLGTYMVLKLTGCLIVEDIENLMVDDPEEAFVQLSISKMFVTGPLLNALYDFRNYTLEELKETRNLPLHHQPREICFPCEIGRFLLRKLTYAPLGLRACNDLIDHYNTYDLQKVQTSLNEAIVTNNPDAVSKDSEELSEILDNVWSDKTIPNRIKNIEIGVPVSIAAIGGIVAGLPGVFAGGFLSELGFKVVEKATEKYAEKLFSVKGEGLTERLAKLRTKSYQANIYDFKKKYNK